MDVIGKRFPLVIQMVLKMLDNQSLSNTKQASRGMAEFLNNERFYWIRIIKKYVKRFEGHKESWREVMKKIPINTLKELTLAVQKFFKSFSFMKMAPLHIVAEKGSFQLCQYIITKTKNKNPEGDFNVEIEIWPIFKLEITNYGNIRKLTSLHVSAINGNADLCRLIVDNINDVNPKDDKGYTPLFFAAQNDHLDAFRIIFEQAMNKNPADGFGMTPFHWAANKGNLEICRLIIEDVKDKNPADRYGRTPLHFAAENGRFDVCKLIIEKVEDKNPIAADGWTPLHDAAKYGHLDICRLIIRNVNNKHPIDNMGETPKNLADENKHTLVSQLFE